MGKYVTQQELIVNAAENWNLDERRRPEGACATECKLASGNFAHSTTRDALHSLRRVVFEPTGSAPTNRSPARGGAALGVRTTTKRLITKGKGISIMATDAATPRTIAANQEAEDIKAALEKMSPTKAAPKDFESEQIKTVHAKFGLLMTPDAVESEIKKRQAQASENKTLTSNDFNDKIEELTTFYQARMWPHALEKAMDTCATLDGLPEEELKKRELDTDRVVVRHNLAAVLHQVGYFDAALHYYAQAKTGMEAWKDPSWFTSCCDSQYKTARLAFVESMMAKAASREKPAPGAYHSSQGVASEFKDDEFEKAVGKAKSKLEEAAPTGTGNGNGHEHAHSHEHGHEHGHKDGEDCCGHDHGHAEKHGHGHDDKPEHSHGHGHK
jgi:hypothetical protein